MECPSKCFNSKYMVLTGRVIAHGNKDEPKRYPCSQYLRVKEYTSLLKENSLPFLV